MNKYVYFCLSLLATASLYADPAITQVIVRQQWPWSTDIKVEYVLDGVEAQHPVNLLVRAFNGNVELPANKLEESITGVRYGISESGVGSFLINPIKAFGQEKVALANFKVKLSLENSDANASEVIYKIFDLTAETGTFACTDVTRADLKNGLYGDFETSYSNIDSTFSTGLSDVLVWTGVTNYPGAKTTKLVMRKIPAGTFSMGQTGGTFGTTGNAEPVHNVTLTKDFYIGVFEMTQEQYRRLGRSQYSGSHNKGDDNPIENAKFTDYRSQITSVFKTNLGVDSLDFPTEAQWEYACRAGTASELYNGKDLSVSGSTKHENIAPIAWYSSNSGDATHAVGLKLPNAFGLYDMIGNVYEACQDNWAVGYPAGDAVDPTGPAAADPDGKLVARGGYYGVWNYLITSAGRKASAGEDMTCGFRLAFTVDE